MTRKWKPDSCSKCDRSKAGEPHMFATRDRGAGPYLASVCKPCVYEVSQRRRKEVLAKTTCAFSGCHRPICRRKLCFTHALQDDVGEMQPIRDWRRRTERNESGEKLCGWCGHWKPEAEFGVTTRNSDGLSDYCNWCRKDRRQVRDFGLSMSRYLAFLEVQSGGCAICGGLNGDGRSLAVDHNHSCCPGKTSCGKCVRGLLCSNCNMAIGLLKEEPVRLEAAISYLKSGGTPGV